MGTLYAARAALAVDAAAGTRPHHRGVVDRRPAGRRRIERVLRDEGRADRIHRRRCARSSSARTFTRRSSIPVSTPTEFHEAIARDFGHARHRPRPEAVGRATSRRRSSTASRSPTRRGLSLSRKRVVARRAQRRRAGAGRPVRAAVRPPARAAIRRNADDDRDVLISRAIAGARRRSRRRPRAHRRRLGARRSAGPRVRRTSISRCSGCPPTGCAPLLERIRPRGHRRRKLHGLQDRRHRRLAAPARVQDRAAGTRASRSKAIPTLSIEEAARRRDFTINAIVARSAHRRDPRSVRRPAAISRPGGCASSTPRTFADDSLRVLARAAVRRAIRTRRSTRTRGALPVDPARRPAGRAGLGRDRKTAAAGRAAVDRPRARAGTSASSHRLLPELVPLATCPQDPEWHPEGDVWTHTLMVVDEARKRIDGLDRGPAVAMMLARALPRPRQAGDDGDHRRPRAIAGTRRGRRRAGDRAARSAERPHARRLRRAPRGARARRASTCGRARSRSRATPVSDGAFRRLAQKVDLELLARFAEADCHGRAGDLRLLGHGLVPRARPHARRRDTRRPRRSCSAGTCSSSASRRDRAWARF